MDKFREFVKKYQWTILLAGAGLLLAILLLTIGFWKTLLLFAIVAVCVVFGVAMDKKGAGSVGEFFSNLFKKGDSGK